MRGTKDRSIIFRCSEEFYIRVRRHADQEHTSMAEFMRRSVEERIENRRKQDVKDVSGQF